MLERVGIEDKLFARCSELSGGEQQRVALARALVSEPAVLLADEPTGNLDPQSTDAVLRLISTAHESGLTVILATHDPQVISAGQADRVLELAGGRFVRHEILSSVRVDAVAAEDGSLSELSLIV